MGLQSCNALDRIRINVCIFQTLVSDLNAATEWPNDYWILANIRKPIDTNTVGVFHNHAQGHKHIHAPVIRPPRGCWLDSLSAKQQPTDRLTRRETCRMTPPHTHAMTSHTSKMSSVMPNYHPANQTMGRHVRERIWFPHFLTCQRRISFAVISLCAGRLLSALCERTSP